MHSTLRSRSALLVTLLAFVLGAVTPTVASAVPEPGAKAKRQGFRLFARSLGALTVNRIYCGLSSDGQICVDSTNSSTIGGGFWPKGTADQYVFNTGLQLAGIIGADGGPWAGDTTGAFFFDPKGTTQHGLEVRPIFNFQNPDDAANWPDAARVPSAPDPVADNYQSLLQGRITASQGDIWFMSWDGNPTLNAGRKHPLGVVVETRGLGWNFPSGNEDLLYFVYTFYNVSSLNDADYAAQNIRPSMRSILVEQAQEFHSRNNAAFGVTLPTAGYTIDPLFAAFGTDMDVASAGTNWAGVILPFALGTTYDGEFDRFQGWTFDPAIFSSPFFAGSGFVGVKYLKSPTGAGEIQLYSNTENGGQFGDPQNALQLFRYLSGQLSIPAGDEPCNSGNPALSRICYLNNSRHFDMRFFQSSTPLSLAPGGLGTIVTGYIFAAPVAVGGCISGPCGDLPPGLQVVGDTPIHGNAALMASPGVPIVDSIAGYAGFNDANSDGIVTQDEYIVVPGSLLGKSLTAQAIFDAQFLLPFSPESPEFFLVPGDNNVTVLWRQSISETVGDPFFAVASDPTNPLYDPNYRDTDVEGYRVYRGRVDAPNSLRLIAEFDYGGTTIRDFAGQVNPDPLCAPELGITTNCGAAFGPFIPGQPRIEFVEVPLVGSVVQVKLGERTALADGTAIVLVGDTAVTGNNSGFGQLRDSGVPFVFVDNGVRNNFRYFYSVTAFDVNSWQSGPSSLESARNTKAVVPVAPASNYENTSTLQTALVGRGVQLCTGPEGDNPCGSLPVPSIDPTTGIFSGPMPPADGWTAKFGDFVQSLIAAPGNFAARLDSISLGNSFWGSTSLPDVYWYTGISGSDRVTFSLTHVVNELEGITGPTASETFAAVSVDQGLASRYGGSSSFKLQGQVTFTEPGYYLMTGTGRSSSLAFNDGVVNEALWDGAAWDGPRWYEGANETFPNPTGGNCQANCDMTVTGNFNNGGSLAGVTTIHQPYSYTTMNLTWREFQGAQQGAQRAADMRVYWGANGAVDSVVDLTHNVLVPFKSKADGSYGFLNTSAQTTSAFDPSTLSIDDFACVAPFHTFDFTFRIACDGTAPYALSPTAELGAIGMVTADYTSGANYYGRTGTGFVMYIAGNFWMFEMSALPAAGSEWTLRDYAGGIYGGKGTDPAGNVVIDVGDYGFLSALRPMTAVGAEMQVQYDVVNKVNRATLNDLSRVHTVPDPYYVTNEFESTTVSKIIKFVNLPQRAIVRIYSSSGVLVRLLEHNSTTFGGALDWDVRNRNNQVVASGVYFYHIEAGDQRRVGRMTVVNFAE